jgi:hypothetical protein
MESVWYCSIFQNTESYEGCHFCPVCVVSPPSAMPFDFPKGCKIAR